MSHPKGSVAALHRSFCSHLRASLRIPPSQTHPTVFLCSFSFNRIDTAAPPPPFQLPSTHHTAIPEYPLHKKAMLDASGLRFGSAQLPSPPPPNFLPPPLPRSLTLPTQADTHPTPPPEKGLPGVQASVRHCCLLPNVFVWPLFGGVPHKRTHNHSRMAHNFHMIPPPPLPCLEKWMP